MNRITWKCNKTSEYHFALNQNCILFYQHNNKPKGFVQLNNEISIKLIDLKFRIISMIKQKLSGLKELKISSFMFGIMIFKITDLEIINNLLQNSYAYIFSSQNTFEFFKKLSQFSFIQNLDQLYTLSDVIAKGGFSRVFSLTPNMRLPNQPFNQAKFTIKRTYLKQGFLKILQFNSIKILCTQEIKITLQSQTL
ncbi:unnamed protein product [Paramecium octaurelia]|uniref:Uncharacterized protein n=1 Tax=Paramecium octaurelia TaxID=43137 RepID=A0A8S1WTS3_PAROT|nr:unnamed protein product [Paramecium octaurelia]